MPVILRTEQEIETRMTAPSEEALKLQRALPDGSLKVVMTGGKRRSDLDNCPRIVLGNAT
jgi:hypothetical protein